jgi:hypothetical protein
MSTSRICSRHFDGSDFKTRIEILNVYHPYKQWNLNAGAIPKHFLLNGNNIMVKSIRPSDGNIARAILPSDGRIVQFLFRAIRPS